MLLRRVLFRGSWKGVLGKRGSWKGVLGKGFLERGVLGKGFLEREPEEGAQGRHI